MSWAAVKIILETQEVTTARSHRGKRVEEHGEGKTPAGCKNRWQELHTETWDNQNIQPTNSSVLQVPNASHTYALP